eukprot:5203007-Amphidinium_carterae.1
MVGGVGPRSSMAKSAKLGSVASLLISEPRHVQDCQSYHKCSYANLIPTMLKKGKTYLFAFSSSSESLPE